MEEINKIINKKPISKKVIICFTVFFAVFALLSVAGNNKAFATATGSFHDIDLGEISKGTKAHDATVTTPGYVAETNLCLGPSTSSGDLAFTWKTPASEDGRKGISITSNKVGGGVEGINQAYVIIMVGMEAITATACEIEVTDPDTSNTCTIKFTVKDSYSQTNWGDYVENGKFYGSSLSNGVDATTNLYARLNVEQISFNAPTQIGILAEYHDNNLYYLSGPTKPMNFENTCNLPLKISKLTVTETTVNAKPLSKADYDDPEKSKDTGAYYIGAMFENTAGATAATDITHTQTFSADCYKMAKKAEGAEKGGTIKMSLPAKNQPESGDLTGRAKNLTSTEVLKMWYSGLLTQTCTWTVVWDTD